MTRFKLISYCIAMVLILSTSVGQSEPQQGGFVDLPMGSRIEGSASYGGIQPDYEISDNDPDLKEFLAKVRARVQETSLKDHVFGKKWAAVIKVTRLVQEALPETAYNSEPYIDLLKNHRNSGSSSIALGKYLACQAGVCRENALLTHLALKEARIENQFVYVKVSNSQGRIEDHAFTVILDGSHLWIVDPYNYNFHGKDLNEIINGGRARSKAPFIFIRKSADMRVLEINSYPKYWVPTKCSAIFNF